jgi:biotin transport system permease protein
MISLTSPIETRAHSWRAGPKLLGLCAATMVLFSLTNLWAHMAIFAMTLGIYAMAGTTFLRFGLRRLRVLWPFVAIVLIWHAVTRDLEMGSVIALRLLSAVALANLVTLTTKLSDMIDVVRYLAAPLRRIGVRTMQLELGIALVVRFTPVLAQKGTYLSYAWRARARKRPNWRIVVPFAVLALDDAEYVADAIKARGGLE